MAGKKPKWAVDTTVVCPSCDEPIKVGYRGPDGLVEHEGKKGCLKTQAKKRKAGEANKAVEKTRTLHDFKSLFKRRPKETTTGPSASSIVTAPSPIIPGSNHLDPDHVQSSPVGTQTHHQLGDVDPADVVPDSRTEPDPLADVRQLAASLPQTVPLATPEDMFAVDHEFPEATPDVDDLWETADRALNNLLGYGRDEKDVARDLRRGELGVDGVVAFLERLLHLGVASVLLEGKITKLRRAIQLLLPLPAMSPSGRPSSPVDAQRPNLAAQSCSLAGAAPEQSGSSFHNPITLEENDEMEVVEVEPITTSLAVWTEKKTPTQKFRPRRCIGIQVELPPGLDPWGSYPFGMHKGDGPPWDVKIINHQLIIQARTCQHTVLDPEQQSCSPCERLRLHPIYIGILDRMVEGVHENSPYQYHSYDGLVQLLYKKNKAIDRFRLLKLNDNRKLLVRSRALDDHKKFVMAIGSGKVERVHALVRVAMRNGAGIKRLLALLDKANAGLYHPKDYDEEDYLRALLFLRLGGARLAELAHRALGTPSLSVVRRNTRVAPIRASLGTPTIEEVAANIEACFLTNGVSESTPVVGGTPYVIMVDEVKCEERVRYDAETGSVLGICREHGHRVPLTFETMDEATLIREAEKKGEIHLATEASVVGLGAMSDDTRIYASRPIVLSGTCKREDANQHATFLENIVTAVNEKADVIKGYPLCLASDGEAKRGKSLSMLTLQQELPDKSPIYPLLRHLSLFNLLCSKTRELTADKDYRHIFKRLRALVIRERGVLVSGVLITPLMVRVHLRDNGVSERRIGSLMNPNDLQDVVLAVSLLKAIWELPPPKADDKPTWAKCRHALNVLGRLFYHLVMPYSRVSLSLKAQLQHLSAAAHLALVLYTQAAPKSAFMPTQLYCDIMIMVKNVFFCVAKVKISSPNGKFWIILLGTDRLETVFGILRTMIGNDCNADMLQLSGRLTSITEVSTILAAHPEWDRAPRRLNLPPMTEPGDVKQKVDHINPASWQGDVNVKPVVLHSCWKLGREMVETELPDLKLEVTLNGLEATKTIDILRPFGELLLDSTGPDVGDEDGGEDADETQERVEMAERAAEPKGAAIDSPPESPSVDLEDLAGAEGDTPTKDHLPSSQRPDYWIVINGKKVHKSQILGEVWRDRTVLGSGDRMRRVQGGLRFIGTISSGGNPHIIDDESAFGGPSLGINDPAATLIRTQGYTFLAIVQVNLIKIDSKPVENIPVDLLSEGIVVVGFQVMKVVARNSDHDTAEGDWEWPQKYLASFKVPGRFILPINPAISTVRVNEPTYLFRSDQLRGIAAALFDPLSPMDIASLPEIKDSLDFPYRSEDGDACFVCEREGVRDRPEVGHCSCSYCPTRTDLSIDKGQRLLEHMGAHILFDEKHVDKKTEPCGFCLRPAPLCVFYLRKTGGSKGGVQIDLKSSRGCFNVSRIAYKSAAKSGTNAPCSNVPIACPLCKNSDPAVWKYNFETHLKKVHPKSASNPRILELGTISAAEKSGMKKIFTARNTARKGKGKSSSKSLVISEAHSSRLAFANVAETSPTTEALELPDEDSANGEDSDEDNLANGLESDDDQSAQSSDEESDEENGESGWKAADDSEDDLPDGSEAGTDEDSEKENYEGETQEPEDPPPVPTPPATPSLPAAVTPPPVETNVRTSGRNKRARFEGAINALVACACGNRVSDAEIAERTKVVKCRNKSCSAKWFHLECFKLDYAPRGWDCGTHEDRPAKRQRV